MIRASLHLAQALLVLLGDFIALVECFDQLEDDASPPVLCPQNGNPMSCNQGQECCVTGDPTQGTQTDPCQSSGSACSGGTVVRCASKADCPGNEICCGTEQTDPQTMMVTYTEVGCAASCTGTSQRVFCDPMATGACPTATPVCGQSQLLPGYTVCQM